METAETSSPLGEQTTFFEAPDVLFVRLVGVVGVAAGAEIDRLHRLWGEQRPRVFYLLDLTRLEAIHPEARKAASRMVRLLPLAGVVAYGASLKARVLATLIFTAMNLFKSAAECFPIEFLDGEAEARGWIEERRRLLDAPGASPSPSPA